MATTTTRLGLRKPDRTDLVSVVTDLNNDYDTIDGAVGFQACTSVTRPSTPYTGKPIYETDTQNELTWDGVHWKYISGSVICTSGTRPASTLSNKGNTIYETDTNNSLIWLGAAWQHLGVPALSTAANFQTPYVGAVYSNTGDGGTYVCVNLTGPVWAPQKGALVGGQVRTTSLSSSSTTEIAFVATSTLGLIASSLYRVTFQSIGTMNSSTVERWAQRIRKTTVTGTQLTVAAIAPATNASQPIGGPISYKYFTTVAENTAFVGTIQRLTSNSAGNTWQVTGPDTFITVEYMGPSAVCTTA